MTLCILDVSNTKQFQRLARDYGHPMSRRHMLCRVVERVGVNDAFIAVHNHNELRELMTLRISLLEWRIVERKHGPAILSAITREVADMGALIPGHWLATLSQAEQAAGKYALGDGFRVTIPRARALDKKPAPN